MLVLKRRAGQSFVVRDRRTGRLLARVHCTAAVKLGVDSIDPDVMVVRGEKDDGKESDDGRE